MDFGAALFEVGDFPQTANCITKRQFHSSLVCNSGIVGSLRQSSCSECWGRFYTLHILLHSWGPSERIQLSFGVNTIFLYSYLCVLVSFV